MLIPLPTGVDIGFAKRIDDAIGQYAVFLKEQFPKHLTLDGMSIVLDCANGAAYKVAPKVLEELGAELFLVGNEPDGQNINRNCGALHPRKVAELVHLYKADIGLALMVMQIDLLLLMNLVVLLMVIKSWQFVHHI